ncbi:MAG TPA: DNA repair protein RecN, partial [Desulfosarcina sp.]|nr:DNA repair protein RecN [Desulfosarcina sp.]
VQMLASITANLASISGQHANQGLLREDTHLAVLDRFGGLDPLARQVKDLYEKLVPLSAALEDLKQKKINQEQQMDLLRYQADEIASADIAPGEDASLEKERLRRKHTEFLYQSVFSSIEALHGADGAVIERIGEIRKNLEKAADLDDALASAAQILADHLFGLEDLTETLRSYLGDMDGEENRLEAVESRLDLINRLKRKYGGTLEALFEKRDAIDAELSAITHIDDEIDRVQKDLEAYYRQLADHARELSEKRRQSAAALSESVEKELEGLKMAGTHFSVQLSRPPCGAKTPPWFCLDGHLLSATGMDQAVFMIAPNVGESMKPLSAIASGGELSRVVLALKAILAGTDAVGTVIFDEVDAGIGGAVADVVGKKLSALAEQHQLICITHLPQIARFGHHHYHIAKGIKNQRTVTTIRPMNHEERIYEIARMLGGETITPTALEHARAMMA